MEMVYPDNIIEISYDTLSRYKDVTAIIIREPLEHLQSALHTEILMWYVLNPGESLSIDTATPLIKNFINTDLNPRGTTHWDVNYYEYLYKFWKQNRNTIKVVNVSDLSPFLKENYDVDLVHDKFSYGIPAHGSRFKYAFTTKQKLAKWIEETLPDIWDDLIRDIPKANNFYNLMINGEISEIYELEENKVKLEAQIIELKNKVDELEKWKFEMILRTKKKLI
jgi:hypothetical protein